GARWTPASDGVISPSSPIRIWHKDLEALAKKAQETWARQQLAATAERKATLVPAIAEHRAGLAAADDDLRAHHAEVQTLRQQHPGLGAEIHASGAAAHLIGAALALLDAFDAYLQQLERCTVVSDPLRWHAPGIKTGDLYFPSWAWLLPRLRAMGRLGGPRGSSGCSHRSIYRIDPYRHVQPALLGQLRRQQGARVASSGHHSGAVQHLRIWYVGQER